MRRLKVILFILCCTAIQSHAQTFYTAQEVGISAGGSQYFGDLNENYGFKYVRPAGGLYIRFHTNPYISVRFTGLYTHVGYDDKLSNNFYNKQRNLNFQSDIGEISFQAEFNFWRFFTGELKSRFTPYITGGIGGFYYNPYTYYNGSRYSLRPLGTEGQYLVNGGGSGKSYSNFSMCFPVGAGVKYWLMPGVNVGFEIADRLTLTDYMDDVSTNYVDRKLFDTDPDHTSAALALQDRSGEVSNTYLGRPGKQRGNSATRDQYLVFVFNISFQFKTYKCPSYLKDGYYMY
ncbi:MAG: hypothetical protein JST82_08180 [Bacteroidetes bacterium]|nr:hypothetical protein [Bacteroidota bacterium]